MKLKSEITDLLSENKIEFKNLENLTVHKKSKIMSLRFPVIESKKNLGQ